MSSSISPADPHLQVSTKAAEMDVVNFQKASPAPGVQASVGRLWEQLKVQDKRLHISGDGKVALYSFSLYKQMCGYV